MWSRELGWAEGGCEKGERHRMQCGRQMQDRGAGTTGEQCRA